MQNCKLMDQYADYTEKLETKYTDLYMAHAEMKKQFGMMRDYFKHPSFLQFKRCTNMLETLMPAERVTKPEGIMNNRPEEVRRFKTFKTAIKGQYYYIAYLKAMLHNNKIDYKKKNDLRLILSIEVMNHLTPGSISWAAFLKMGALLENSPNSNLRPAVMP